MTTAAPTATTHLIKRDGSVRAFDAARIASALTRAGHASGEFGDDEALRLTNDAVLPALAAQVAAPGAPPLTPHVEQVQDLVEAALFAAGHRRTLRAYTVYREQHRKLRDASARWSTSRPRSRIPAAARLARQRQRQPGLLAGRV